MQVAMPFLYLILLFSIPPPSSGPLRPLEVDFFMQVAMPFLDLKLLLSIPTPTSVPLRPLKMVYVFPKVLFSSMQP